MTGKIYYCISLSTFLTNTCMPIYGCLIVRHLKLLNVTVNSLGIYAWRRIRDYLILLDLGKLKILSNLPKVTQLESSRTGPESWALDFESFLTLLISELSHFTCDFLERIQSSVF